MSKNPLPNKVLTAHICLLLAGLMWAAAGPIIKITLGYIPPATFLFLRFLIVAVILLPYTIYELIKVKVHKEDYLNLFLLGVTSQSAIYLLFLAYNYTSVLDITIISVVGSVLSVYLGHYFYKDKVDSKLTIGLILASLGTLVVFMEPLFTGDTENTHITQRLLGNLLALAYNLAWVIFLIWSKMSMGERSSELKKTLKFLHIKPLKHPYSSTLIVSISFYTGLITLLPIAIFENIKSGVVFNIAHLDPMGIFGLLYMAIVSSIMAYMLYEYGLEYAKVSDTAIYGYLHPLLTLPFAYYLVGELPNVYMLVGSAIIAVGVIIAEARKY